MSRRAMLTLWYRLNVELRNTVTLLLPNTTITLLTGFIVSSPVYLMKIPLAARRRRTNAINAPTNGVNSIIITSLYYPIPDDRKWNLHFAMMYFHGPRRASYFLHQNKRRMPIAIRWTITIYLAVCCFPRTTLAVLLPFCCYDASAGHCNLPTTGCPAVHHRPNPRANQSAIRRMDTSYQSTQPRLHPKSTNLHNHKSS